MSTDPRLMAHMVAFYPDREASRDVARGIIDGGAAYLEVQFPFSDPTADGPDIQGACTAALAAGFRISRGFQLLSEIRKLGSIPIFLMSYANLLFTHGMERFLTSARESGAAGVIVPDLPPDYDEGLFEKARPLGLFAVPVVSPSMRQERLQRIAALRPEYIYATLRTGTTGSLTRVDGNGLSFLERVRALGASQPPKILGGFGISSPAQVAEVASHVHAVVVGSAIVREIAKAGDHYAAVRRKVAELTGAAHGAGAVTGG